MLTVDFDHLGVGTGTTVIDVGCGAGRHSFEAFRRGADVVAFDQSAEDLNDVDAILQAMADQGEAPASAKAEAVKGDALELPYADGTFDVVMASEIPAAGSPSPSRAGCPRRCAGCCPTSTTPTRAGTSGSIVPTSCRRRSLRSEWISIAATTRTPCMRRSGG